MAEEEKNAAVENDEAKEGASKETEAKKKKQSLFTPKNIGIMAGIIVVLSVGAFFGVKMLIKDKEPPKKEEKVKEKPGVIYDFSPPLIVNIAGTSGTRYLKVKVGIEFDEVILEEEITARKSQLLDLLNTVFSGKTINQIVSVEERNNIKREIRDKFNSILISGQIKNVFFSDFVIQ